MSNFDQAFANLISNEGGYSNHPDDPGGETNWGITVSVARAHGYSGQMRDMPQETAKDIYRRQYWRAWMDGLPYQLAFQVFDAAVNSGPGQAAKWLQRAVGVQDDGVVGPVTLAAIGKSDSFRLAVIFCAFRLEFLVGLPTWPTFGKGWARRIIGNLKKAVG